MSEFYIATRADFNEMHSVVGTRVTRLNQKMATTLRQAAMKLDIRQKTKDGGRLEFYCVDQAGFEQLTDSKHKLFALLKGQPNVRPLAWLKRDNLTQAINTVNAKYTGGMDYRTHQKYLAELKATTGALLTKLEEDVKAERPVKPKLAPNPFKVGDLLSANWEYSAPKEFTNLANCRVARTTDAYVWLEFIGFKDLVGITHNVWSNTDSVRSRFPDALTYGSAGQWENHGHFIPLSGNEDALGWFPSTDHKGRLVRQRWDKVAGYRNKPVPDTTPVGYCYSREPNYD